MSVRAENRHRAFSRREASAEIAAAAPRMEVRSLLDEINENKGEIARLRAEVERLRLREGRFLAALRRLRVLVTAARKERDRERAGKMDWLRIAETMKRRWQYASRCIRDLVSPERYHAWREHDAALHNSDADDARADA